MYLLLSIILCAILGFILLMMGPIIGGVIAFGIVVGCIFRGLYLLNDIHKRISNISPREVEIQEVNKEKLEEEM